MAQSTLTGRGRVRGQKVPALISGLRAIPYEILPLLLKFIGEQGFVKNFCQGYNFYFLHLINDFFKTIANSLSQSQEIDNIS